MTDLVAFFTLAGFGLVVLWAVFWGSAVHPTSGSFTAYSTHILLVATLFMATGSTVES